MSIPKGVIMTNSSRTDELINAGIKEPASKCTKKDLAGIKKNIESQIDNFLKKVGYTDPKAITDENGIRHFEKGSVQGFALVEANKTELFFHVRSLIMDIPSDKELIVPLYRSLLELNLSLFGPVRIGIMNNRIFAGVSYPAEMLIENDVERFIFWLMNTADDIDEKLLGRYGGTAKKRSGK
jgi:hypothetical protein